MGSDGKFSADFDPLADMGLVHLRSELCERRREHHQNWAVRKPLRLFEKADAR